MKMSIKNAYYMAGALVTSLMFTNAASAETLSGMMKRLTEQMSSVAAFGVAVMFVLGVFLGGLSILKFKEHSDNPGQAKLGKPIGYLFASVALIGIPSYLAVFTNTLTGESHDSSDSSGEAYSKIR